LEAVGMLKVKRVYEVKGADDGRRILVDRLWPRGLRRSEAAIDEWMKEVAPSDELRRWFGHREERWHQFRERYRDELRAPGQMEILRQLARDAQKGNVTILYSAKDTERNNARVLAGFISELTGAGI